MSNKIQKRTTAQIVLGKLEENRSAIMASLPKGFNFDRMCRTAINAISTTPSIAQCTPASVFLSCIRAFAIGLEPNSALAHGYLVPFKNKGVSEAQFMPSYRGMIELARRSGQVGAIYARDVREHDQFSIHLGTANSIEHTPKMDGDRGAAIGFYAVFHLLSGGVDFEYMTVAEIDKVRATSKAKASGPWVEWPTEMAKKTVIKRLLKRAPMSVELANAVELDNQAVTGGEQPTIIDVTDLDLPTEGTSSLEQG